MRDQRTASAIGIDATRPFGEEFATVADVPGWQAYDFPDKCTPVPGYNPLTDTFRRDLQYPIWTGLPLAKTSGTRLD